VEANAPALLLSDLDGTLLDSNHALRPRVRAELERIGTSGVTRAVATGRSLYAAQRVLDASTPIDYLIFSSGAGIASWPAATMIYAQAMPSASVERAAAFFIAERMDFLVHDAPPDSHRFAYVAFSSPSPVDRRVQMYREHARELSVAGGAIAWPGTATQLLAMPREGDHTELHRRVQSALTAQQVVRTTSPLNDGSLWLEVFPPQVSKDRAAAWLAARLGIDGTRTYAVGNDFNDESLLSWAASARVVGNGPASLRARFGSVPSNDADGVAHAIAAFGL